MKKLAFSSARRKLAAAKTSPSRPDGRATSPFQGRLWLVPQFCCLPPAGWGHPALRSWYTPRCKPGGRIISAPTMHRRRTDTGQSPARLARQFGAPAENCSRRDSFPPSGTQLSTKKKTHNTKPGKGPARLARQFGASAENCSRRDSLPPWKSQSSTKKKTHDLTSWVFFLVETAGLEPTTPCV